MSDNDLFSVADKRPSAVDIVVDRIKQLLIEKKIGPSEIIPSEQALADKLMVSRGSVREAMKILSAFGIVEIRRGDGTYISSASNKKLFDPLLFQILVQDRDYQSLMEIRQILEVGIIQLLIQKATDQELQILRKTLAEFESALKRKNSSAEECNAIDLKYHQLMGKFSHNTIVENIYSFIIDLFSPTINSKHKGVPEIHRELQQALESRDIQKALKSILHHTEIWKESSGR